MDDELITPKFNGLNFKVNLKVVVLIIVKIIKVGGGRCPPPNPLREAFGSASSKVTSKVEIRGRNSR